MLNQAYVVMNLAIIYGLLSVCVYLTFRVMDFPDLTVDGSFVVGGALAVLIIKNGYSPYSALITPFLGGALCGLFTAILHLKFKINGILSGILTMTMLYSINLRLLGAANVSIHGLPSIFGQEPLYTNLCAGLLFLAPLMLMFKTYFGLVLKAVGQNEHACRLYNINTAQHKYFLIVLSNGLAAVVGSLMVQYQGFCDISMGFGLVITGLACIMLGETIARKTHHISSMLMWIMLGSLVYRTVIQWALNLDELGIQASDLKLVTGVMVIASIILSRLYKGVRHVKHA